LELKDDVQQSIAMPVMMRDHLQFVIHESAFSQIRKIRGGRKWRCCDVFQFLGSMKVIHNPKNILTRSIEHFEEL
jgi:hypothetical protein